MADNECSIFWGISMAMITFFVVVMTMLLHPQPAPSISLIEYERIYTCHIRFGNDGDKLMQCIEDKP
jgi:hypothetical protein